MNKELIDLPASFRVIGVGHGIDKVINTVNSFGFAGVSAEVVKYPYDCTPKDDDKLAIVVFSDCDENADGIAKTFHEAGVLTLGLSEDAAPSYFDSILEGVNPSEYPYVIKSLLLPIIKPCYVSFDFHDLSTVLRDSGYFIIKRVIGESMTDVVEKMQEELKNVDLHDIENLTFNIFLNSNRMPPLEMKDMAVFSEMLATLPDTVNVIWAVHFDEELNDNQIGLLSIMSGKDLENVQ